MSLEDSTRVTRGGFVRVAVTAFVTATVVYCYDTALWTSRVRAVTPETRVREKCHLLVAPGVTPMPRATAALAAPARVAFRGAHRDRRAASTRVSSTSASVTADVESLAAWVTDQGGDVSATRVDVGDRGRGLFASRDVEAGEVVLRVPIGSALNDGRADPPYPGAPWSVVLAAELLRERAKGDDARLSRYVRSLPSETIGFANSTLASREGAADLLADDAAFDELERYDFLLRGSAAAVQKHHAFDDWRWAMSLAHSRTFRVEEPAPSGDEKETLGATRRLMVPYVDLLNHDSRETEVQCEWSCVWDLGGGGGDFVVKTTRDVRQGEELVTSYGERDDRHFFLFFGFLPEPNPHNGVALFRGLEEAAAWYEALCGDGEEAKEAWASARREAVATVRAETERLGADRPDERERERETGWTSADAEAEEAAALRAGADAAVDERLLRLFEILSGDPDVAVAAVRVRAQRLLEDMRDAEARVDAGFAAAAALAEAEALALESAAGYRRRRRVLLEEIA